MFPPPRNLHKKLFDNFNIVHLRAERHRGHQSTCRQAIHATIISKVNKRKCQCMQSLSALCCTHIPDTSVTWYQLLSLNCSCWLSRHTGIFVMQIQILLYSLYKLTSRQVLLNRFLNYRAVIKLSKPVCCCESFACFQHSIALLYQLNNTQYSTT